MMNDWAGVPADYGDVLRRAMDSLFRTFENFSEGTFIVDADARVVWINKRYAARFGFSDPQQAMGRDCEAVIPNSLMREVVNTGKPILLDIMETDREPLVVTRLPLKDDTGATVGAVGFALFDELKALTPLFSHYSRVQEELIATRQSLAQARRAKYTFGSFVGTSAASLEVKRQARRAAQLESPVLLLGETGTGKELLAHAIHGGSARANQPLVTVNVAAIPDTLLEVEFFGAAPGAYTGADRKGRVGKFELANGGTLFLDEIGDMPLSVQGKLLRVLQDKEFEPLGSNRIVRADVRIIAATSADLPALVAAGRFRADLFYRLNVLTIHAPPCANARRYRGACLRDARGSVDASARRQSLRTCRTTRCGCCARTRGPAMCASCATRWSGRSCFPIASGSTRGRWRRSSVRRKAARLPGGPPQCRRPPRRRASSRTNPPSWSDAMAAFEKRFLIDALRANGGRVIDTATQIGMGRATLYKKIAAYGIDV